MNKKALRIVAGCLALLLIGGLAWFANGLLGNPVSSALAKRTARAYLAAHYADTDYEIDRIGYSFKDVGYFAHIKSPTSVDGDFTLRISMTGKLKSDDYAFRVAGHGNIADRLYFEYRALVDGVLQSPLYPYTVSMAYGDLAFSFEVGATPPPNAVRQTDLENDKLYNVSELGKTNGYLVLYIDCDTVTPEKAAEILLKTKELLDTADVGFYAVHFVLQYPPTGDSHQRPEGEINLRSFPAADIYGEGLRERVIAAHEATMAYYAASDAEK